MKRTKLEDKLVRLIKRHGQVRLTITSNWYSGVNGSNVDRERILTDTGYVKYCTPTYTTPIWDRSCYIYVESGYLDKKLKDPVRRSVRAMLEYDEGSSRKIQTILVGKKEEKAPK